MIVETTTIHGELPSVRRIFRDAKEFKAWLSGHPNVMILIDSVWHKPHCKDAVEFLSDLVFLKLVK